MSTHQHTNLGELLAEYDSTAHTDEDRNWLRGFLKNIALEARSGRLIPIVDESSDKGPAQAAQAQASGPDELWQTEGALLDLIRATVDGQDSLLIEHLEFLGDVSQSRADIGVSLTAVVLLETPANSGSKKPTLSMHEAAARARERVRAALNRHSQLRVGAIDVRITDLIPLPHGEGLDD